jgi:hypothetical protein
MSFKKWLESIGDDVLSYYSMGHGDNKQDFVLWYYKDTLYTSDVFSGKLSEKERNSKKHRAIFGSDIHGCLCLGRFEPNTGKLAISLNDEAHETFRKIGEMAFVARLNPIIIEPLEKKYGVKITLNNIYVN